MRRLTIGAVTVSMLTPLLLYAGVGRIQAATIPVDFEEFSDGYNLHGVNLGGVTLTNPSGRVEIYDDRFGVSYHSATKAVASLAGFASVNPLVGTFDKAVSSVSLWGGDKGWSPTEIDSWELRAFDARIGGNLVGRVSSGSWDGSPYRQLSISAPKIWRFEASWTGAHYGIGYDDLRFVTIDPPSPPKPKPPPDGPGPEGPPITLDPSNASFQSSENDDDLYIDFGELPQAYATSAKSFDIWNRASSGTTATLNLGGVSGDPGGFWTNLDTFVPLAPNASQKFTAFLDTSTPGEFSSSIVLTFGDVTGTPQPPLTIFLNGVVFIPEPSSVVLAAVGLLSFLAWGWRRRKAG